MSVTMKVGDSSPWGRIDYARELVPGVVQVGTSSHGGLYLSPERNAAVPEVFRQTTDGDAGWYEEDCEWAKVAFVFPEVAAQMSEPETLGTIEKTVKQWYPDAYEAFTGAVIAPGESIVKDRREFLRANADRLISISAFGDWDDRIPKGWVGVAASLGGERTRTGPEGYRYFLVPEAEYETRSPYGFVCDPERHPAWDLNLLKTEQVLFVSVPQAIEEDSLSP
jgi:hypothetical protein